MLEIKDIFRKNLYLGIIEQFDLLLKTIDKAYFNVLKQIDKDIANYDLSFKQGYMCAKINICDIIEQMKRLFEEQSKELKNEEENTGKK